MGPLTLTRTTVTVCVCIALLSTLILLFTLGPFDLPFDYAFQPRAYNITYPIHAHDNESTTATCTSAPIHSNTTSDSSEFSPFIFPCEIYDAKKNITYDHLEYGCLQKNYTKLQLTRDVCLGQDQIVLLARDQVHFSELERCCTRHETIALAWETLDCAPDVQAACRATLGKKGGTKLSVSVTQKSGILKRGLTYLHGNSFWLHTPPLEEHFGHQVNRYMQLFNLMHDSDSPRFERVVSRQVLPLHDHLRAIAAPILEPLIKYSYFMEHLLEHRMRMVCMEKAWEPARDQLEIVLHSEDEAIRWREFASNVYSKLGYNRPKECPPATAIVLQRTEGTGARRILNYDVLDRVFAKHGMSYVNVSIGMGDTSEKQISVFSSFGLMISSHSSQLKNLIFAPKNSIVIETRGTPWGYMQPSPFSMGIAEPLHVLFYESLGHRPDYTSCPESHGCRETKLYKTDYWLNETLFEETFAVALQAQKVKCGDIWQKK